MPIRLFLRNVLRFTGFAVVGLCLCALVFVLYLRKEHIPLTYFPPPMISDSYSYNDKALFARNKQADIVTIGSSMSLNNVNSEEITHYFKSDSYLNLSSWGMTPKDIFYLTKTYSSIHKPGTLIINGSLEDFIKDEKRVDYKVLREFLTTTQLASYYLKNGNLMYYVKKIQECNEDKSRRNIYRSLVYDKYGAVPFDPKGLVRDEPRWMHVPDQPGLSTEYDYMDSIAVYCRTQNIRLIYFESPVREGLVNAKNEATNRTHNAIVEKILTNNGQAFVRSGGRTWPDSLFVDGIHMSGAGAAVFTRYCLDRLAVDSLQPKTPTR